MAELATQTLDIVKFVAKPRNVAKHWFHLHWISHFQNFSKVIRLVAIWQHRHELLQKGQNSGLVRQDIELKAIFIM